VPGSGDRAAALIADRGTRVYLRPRHGTTSAPDPCLPRLRIIPEVCGTRARADAGRLRRGRNLGPPPP
jgi:hypothetical protein